MLIYFPTDALRERGGDPGADQQDVIEGGGEVLGQALDARVIDKVQLYLGPILTVGPIIAFPGRGAKTAASALHLQRVSYEQVGQSVCIKGYPEVRPSQ